MSQSSEGGMTSRPLPLVSVLTPVYNGERYLAECIESVLAQTYQNWEYVIVNNCSKDRTLEIAQDYASQDHRIRVHSNPALVPMNENHNIAFQQMSPESDYCKMVHADDWLFPQCLAEMVKVAEANLSVGVVGAYGLEGTKVKWDGLPYPSTVVSGREICRRTLLGGFFVFGSPTSIMFRSNFVRARKEFYNSEEPHTQYADEQACFDVLKASDFGFVHQVLTYTRLHEESTTSAFVRTGFNTDLPAKLSVLVTYGPTHLSSDEQARRLGNVLESYYGFLAANVFLCRKRDFWSYHKKRMKEIGCPLSRAKLASASLRVALNPLVVALSNVFKFVKTLLRTLFARPYEVAGN
jgi:glycosyltransferase involved in cell wall biosynthesis